MKRLKKDLTRLKHAASSCYTNPLFWMIGNKYSCGLMLLYQYVFHLVEVEKGAYGGGYPHLEI